eukprot:1080236-Lingulodinium_polyedra.AAC.1
MRPPRGLGLGDAGSLGPGAGVPPPVPGLVGDERMPAARPKSGPLVGAAAWGAAAPGLAGDAPSTPR